MKSLRISALMLVLGISPLCSLYAHAQQEIDPDHFDRATAVRAHAQKSRVRSNNKPVAAHHGSTVMLASKSSHNANHRSKRQHYSE